MPAYFAGGVRGSHLRVRQLPGGAGGALTLFNNQLTFSRGRGMLLPVTEGAEFKPGVPLRPQRVSVEVPVRYRRVGEESWYVGRSENLSRVGLLIRVVHPLPLEASVEVTMNVPAGLVPGMGGETVFTGTVARQVPASGGPLRIGIAFKTFRRAPHSGP